MSLYWVCNVIVTLMPFTLLLVAGDDTWRQLGSAVKIAAAAADCVTVPHWKTFKIHIDTVFDLDFVVADLVEQDEKESFSDWPIGSSWKVIEGFSLHDSDSVILKWKNF